MAEAEIVKFYTPREEKINVVSHVLGFLLSAAGLILLLIRASLHGNAWHIVSVAVFGLSMMALYGASACYHSASKPALRLRLRIVDHASIYLLIAGTYTPFMLITLKGTVGWVIFSISWGMAATGITLKLFFTGKYQLLSTLMYVFMGWLIIFAIKPLIANLAADGLFWVLAGGVAYTIGAILYSIKSIPYNHATFHLLVLAGSICHFIAIYQYVLPGS